jgi:plasmid stabilization system protein ParE
MQNNRFVVSPQAGVEIEEIALWYETQATNLGNRFLIAVNNSIEKIAEQPAAFSYYKKGLPIRKSVMKGFPFVIYFIDSKNTVEVIAVIHFRRSKNFTRKRLR